MEYVEGADLAQLIEARSIPVGPALAIVEEVAGALHAAYGGSGRDGQPLRLLHRDLKPSNIRLTPQGEVKLLDFGIARADFAGREAETRSLLFGSLPYMAPERMDLRSGPESDVYSLGAVLYECLAGEALGRTSATLPRHEAHLGRSIDRLSGRLPDRLSGRLPDRQAVVDFVVDLLAYEPAAQPTAREVERRCHHLLREMDTVPLRDWAEEVVPAVLGRRETGNDRLTGSLLIAGSIADIHDDGEVAGPEPQASRGRAPSRLSRLGVLLALLAATTILAVVLLVAGTGSAVWWWSQEDAAPKSSLPPEAAVESERLVGDRPAVRREEAGELTHEPEVPPSRSAAPRAVRRSPAASEPAPRQTPRVETEPEIQTATARVEGSARSVKLVAAERRYSPGAVPAGTYDIVAVFGAEGAVVAGSVRLLPGASVTLVCDDNFMCCVEK